MRVARRRAVRDHRHRLAGGVRRIGRDLDVEHRRQPAETLRADAERVDLVVELDAQLLELVGRAARLAARPCRSRPSAIPWPAASPFRRCRRCRCPSMPGGHQPAPIVGTVFSTQSTMQSLRIHHHQLALVLAAAALGRDGDRRPCRRGPASSGSPPACCRRCSSARSSGRPGSMRAACSPDRCRRGARLR